MVAKDSFSNYNSIATAKNQRMNLQLQNEGLELNIPNDDALLSPNRQNIQANVVMRKNGDPAGAPTSGIGSCSPVRLSNANKAAFTNKTGADEYSTR
jgi:hypothetical protein